MQFVRCCTAGSAESLADRRKAMWLMRWTCFMYFILGGNKAGSLKRKGLQKAGACGWVCACSVCRAAPAWRRLPGIHRPGKRSLWLWEEWAGAALGHLTMGCYILLWYIRYLVCSTLRCDADKMSVFAFPSFIRREKALLNVTQWTITPSSVSLTSTDETTTCMCHLTFN